MATYVLAGRITQTSPDVHAVVVTATPDKGEASWVGVIVRRKMAASQQEALVLREQLMREVRAEVSWRGDLIVEVEAESEE